MNIKNQSAWSHPIVKGMVGVAAFVIVAEVLVIYIPDAWAATTIQITDRYVVQLGELPQWIIAFVAAGGLWKAWKAEQKINAVSVQIDGVLAERDKAKVIEGEAKGKQAGVDTAIVLAEGHRQGVEQERASVAAAGKGPLLADGKPPLPVADDRTAGAAERVAEATERVASATEGSQPQVKRE